MRHVPRILFAMMAICAMVNLTRALETTHFSYYFVGCDPRLQPALKEVAQRHANESYAMIITALIGFWITTHWKRLLFKIWPGRRSCATDMRVEYQKSGLLRLLVGCLAVGCLTAAADLVAALFDGFSGFGDFMKGLH